MATHIEDFAALLRELKERSGRSYGQLAARLHVSTSTLHRYCNGAAVPTDYAPVERLARVCGATPDELVTLHRRWLLADASRREPERAPEREAGQETRQEPEREQAAEQASEPVAAATPPAEPPAELPPASDASDASDPGDAQDTPWRPGRRRGVLVLGAAAAVAAVAAAAALPTLLHGGARTQNLGDSSPAPGHSVAGVGRSTSASPLGSLSASASASASPSTSTSPSPSGTAGSASAVASTSGGRPPFRVSVLADNWDQQCGQWFLINQQPAKVPPPPSLEQTGAWASALGGIPAGHLRLQLTAQGLSSRSVVLNSVSVHVVSRAPAPKGTVYTPGSGCGGGLDPASFAVNLDQTVPFATPVPGTVGNGVTSQLLNFPFQVSATDPQVIDVDASTAGQDVSWYLVLTWSSPDGGGRFVVKDDDGRPFRTVGLKGDPAYVDNGNGWVPAQADP